MAKITAGQVVARVDASVPNPYPMQDKLRWLTEAEGLVRREIFGSTGELLPLREDSPLTAPMPYESLYERFVEAQLHYAQGELDRYNSAAAAWNGTFLAYKDFVSRTAQPGKERRTIKFY